MRRENGPNRSSPMPPLCWLCPRRLENDEWHEASVQGVVGALCPDARLVIRTGAVMMGQEVVQAGLSAEPEVVCARDPIELAPHEEVGTTVYPEGGRPTVIVVGGSADARSQILWEAELNGHTIGTDLPTIRPY